MLDTIKNTYAGLIEYFFPSSDEEIQIFIDQKERDLPRTGNPKDDTIVNCSIMWSTRTFNARSQIRRQVCRVAANRFRGNPRCDGGDCDPD